MDWFALSVLIHVKLKRTSGYCPWTLRALIYVYLEWIVIFIPAAKFFLAYEATNIVRVVLARFEEEAGLS